MPDMSSTKKKRKLKSTEEKQKPPKTHRIDESHKPNEVEESESSKRQELEVASPWRNLQLILSIQKKDIELQRKVELAFEHVNWKLKGGDEDTGETVTLPRLISFLNDWVQSLLISTDKKVSVGGVKLQPWCGVIDAFLDYRCWVIFRFCVDNGLRLKVSLSFSRNLLRTVGYIARNVSSLLGKQSFLIGEEFEFYSLVLHCVSSVFSTQCGLSNENLDLWVSTVTVVLEFVRKIYEESIENANVGVFALEFCCLVLDPFAKFLRVHPTRKNGFRDFVDQLLEPLLDLLGVLRLHVDRCNPSLTGKLIVIIEEVLSQGLFHPTHIDGFLSLRAIEKYRVSKDGETKNLKTVLKSYHRHLFDKLERILVARNQTMLTGYGELFHLLVDRVTRQTSTSVLPIDTKMAGSTSGLLRFSGDMSEVLYRNNNAPPDNSSGSSNLNTEKRKSLFDFFLQIMEPFLLELNGYLQIKFEVGPLLFDIHRTLKSVNHLLVSLLHKNIYVKTEDTSEGACLNFLKKIYSTIFSLSTKLVSFPIHDVDVKMQDRVVFLARELLVAVGYFLDIEYEVIENDLTSLWFMLLSYSVLSHSFKNTPDLCSLTSQILGLGCQLVKLYGDLRQAKSAVFALCKAMRLIIVRDCDSELSRSCATSTSYELYAKSIQILPCAQEFKLAVHNVIKSIPEGQASECIGQLSADLSESLEWMKTGWSMAGESDERSGMTCFDQQTELFGRGLSVMYALVLDSLPVTVGNSILVGRSITDLMNVMRPCLSILVGSDTDRVSEFFSCVTESASDATIARRRHDMKKFQVSTHWVFVFFFRLYMSCRSLCRQAICLMPPNVSRKISAAMGDPSMASGREWVEITDWKNEGYFSWISQPSASLLVIIQSASDVCLEESSSTEDCCPLIYLLHAMILQRLVDMNRQIKSLEYVLESNGNTVRNKLLGDTCLKLYSKRCKKWERRISSMKQEAEALTEFMLRYTSLFGNDLLMVNTSDDGISSNICDINLDESEKWLLDVCSVDKKSLPAAIWWILCQNIDIWSIHASKKKLKVFFSLVICASLPTIARSLGEGGKHHIMEASPLKKMSISKISSDLLTDSILYEHKFVRRNFASIFCRLLEKSVLPEFSDLLKVDINLRQSLNWEEILNSLENSSKVVLCGKPANISRESTGMRFTACQDLLSLFCWMPKEFMTSRSFLLYATHLLNLERFVIHSLLECQDALSPYNWYELLSLLVSCRRAIKYLVVAYFEEKTGFSKSSLTTILSKEFVLWLFMSVSTVACLQERLSEHCADQVGDMLFSLMDHTFYVFLTLSRYQSAAINVCGSRVDSLKDVEAWNRVLLLAETLKEQTQGLLISLKGYTCKKKVGDDVNVVDLNKLSSVVCCFSGFLWGLASAFKNGGCELLRKKCASVSRINLCIKMFADFISFSLHMLSSEDHHQLGNLCDTKNFIKSDDMSGLVYPGQFSFEGAAETEQRLEPAAAKTCLESSDIGDGSGNASVCRRSLHSRDASSVASVLNKVGLYQCQSSNNVLQVLLNDHHREAASLIRQLFIASSAILRLNLLTRCTPLLSSLVPNFIGISEALLLRLADGTEVPEALSLVWLDGVLKYLQELGDHFPSTNPMLTQDVYTKLIELHLKALGKCISLQGKEATLSSHEKESTTKMLHGNMESSGVSVSYRIYGFDDFKARLRMSFKAFVRNPSELHLVSAIQAIERALVGVHNSGAKNYEVSTGSADGGKVSSTVAAGIDCLDLVLEYVSRTKRLNDVRRHIQSLIGALLNIILHLQSSSIFYTPSTGCQGQGGNSPDPGATILMCVEVLTTVSRKHDLFQMDSWQVAQCLHIPAALFQDFHQLGICKYPPISNSSEKQDCDSLFLEKQDCDPPAGMKSHVVDRQFSVELFSACCRLLYTTLKHHRRKVERCIAQLQESSVVLLHCLEAVNSDLLIKKGYFSWGLQEGVNCASLLRRIYEELRQQKDVFGRYCFNFLCDYIWVYSGYGPLKSGIKREVDEALRPGIYALLDTCSPDDFQHLHTAFGEGPCRNTLAMLQHDYKLNFQYEGKV